MNPSHATSSSLTTPPASIAPRFSSALGGIWRITWRRVFTPKDVLITLGLITALALYALSSALAGQARGFLTLATGFYLTQLMPILAFVSGGGAIREDMKPGIVDYLLTRPVPRPVFVVTRFLCQLACVQLTCLVAFVALLGVGMSRGVPGLAELWPVLLVAQIITLTVFMAFGFALGSFSSRYLVLGLMYAGIIELGLGRIPIQLSKLSMLRHVQAMVETIAPGIGSFSGEPQGVLLSVAVLTVFTLVWLLAAVVIFSVQEFAGQRPKDA